MAGGNDYLIQVKGNQPKLLARIKQITQKEEPLDTCSTTEKEKGRIVTRLTNVYANTGGFHEGWIELNRIIEQRRSGKRSGKYFEENHYFISSKKNDEAQYFAGGIRSHWGVENKVHWVKDVLMNEDGSRIKSKEIVSNLSLFRTGVISLFRINNHPSITIALEKFTNRLEKCMDLISKSHICET